MLVSKKIFYGGNLREEFIRTKYSHKNSHYTSEGELRSETITEFNDDNQHSNKVEKEVSRIYDIKNKKILVEEVREYRINQTIFTRKVFDVEKGTLVSEEVNEI